MLYPTELRPPHEASGIMVALGGAVKPSRPRGGKGSGTLFRFRRLKTDARADRVKKRGEVPERLKGPVLKTGVALVVTGGSNPPLSARLVHRRAPLRPSAGPKENPPLRASPTGRTEDPQNLPAQGGTQ